MPGKNAAVPLKALEMLLGWSSVTNYLSGLLRLGSSVATQRGFSSLFPGNARFSPSMVGDKPMAQKGPSQFRELIPLTV